jgi:hypothetical protein
MPDHYAPTEAGRIIAALQQEIEQLRKAKPATLRMEGAHRVAKDAITRELCWAAIGARIWPAHLAPPRTPQQSFTWLHHLDTPAGRIVYRVTDEELPLFDHVLRVKYDDTPSGDKLAILHALATVGS